MNGPGLSKLQDRAGSAVSGGLGARFRRVLQSSFAFSGRRTLERSPSPIGRLPNAKVLSDIECRGRPASSCIRSSSPTASTALGMRQGRGSWHALRRHGNSRREDGERDGTFNVRSDRKGDCNETVKGRKAHLVGSGIGNLAAAAYLIKDGGFSGANISHLRGGKVYRADVLTQLALLKRVTSCAASACSRRITSACTICFLSSRQWMTPLKTIKQDTLEFTNRLPLGQQVSPWAAL